MNLNTPLRKMTPEEYEEWLDSVRALSAALTSGPPPQKPEPQPEGEPEPEP